jgi:hypothetical protein
MSLPASNTELPTIPTRTTTKIAVNAAHIIFRCHAVGYFLWASVRIV